MPATSNPETYRVTIGSQETDLPIVELGQGERMALMITVDMGVGFMARAGEDLAALLRDLRPDVIAAPATLGIPLALEVSRALGHEDYVVLQKSRKWYLRDSPRLDVNSITTQDTQTLILDKSRIPLVRGKRVVVVDDVLSTGASVATSVELLEQVGAEVVGIGAMLTESDLWVERLGAHAANVRALGEVPFPVPPQG
ncbi:phosphoribosyltransferase family protein [Arenivirga flava]|uniref:Phosphoribosyltransferase n=1 Tax=Arenivirga flava TaxID=1930060 RepID=A0AA37UGB9_9MICO|nr:phosphoribosyltransferase family protein [Arenivirga flava]GMA29859.1 phosphoribosyltransferase [Arenivirga flava]